MEKGFCGAARMALKFGHAMAYDLLQSAQFHKASCLENLVRCRRGGHPHQTGARALGTMPPSLLERPDGSEDQRLP
jgi:hypothetical protein